MTWTILTRLGRGLLSVGLGVGFAFLLQPIAGATSVQSSTTTTSVAAQSSVASQEEPKVTFVFDHPEVAPNHFEIVVDRSGKGRYVSHSDPNADSSDAGSA